LKKFVLASHLLVLILCSALLPVAQAQLTLRVTANPRNISLGETVTYSIIVSNTSSVQAQSIQISSSFPPSTAILRAANTYTPSLVDTNQGNVTFGVSTLPGGSQARMELDLRPADRGAFVNNVVVSGAGINTVSTNISATVAQAQVDLALGIEGFPTNVLVGDAFDYTVTVTNFGPGIAGSVNVQSVLPTGLQFLSVTPSVPTTFTPTTRILSLQTGSITNSTARDFIVRLQANSALTNKITNSVVTAENSDSSATNDTAIVSLTVLPFVTNRLAIISATPQILNRQNALIEQLIVVTNLTTNTIQSVRVMVTNLTSPNRLYNASGSNSMGPYVMVPGGLAPTNTATVLLQYLAPNRDPIPASFVAVEGPELNPLVVPAGTPIPITRVAQLRIAYDPQNPRQRHISVYIEFIATPGRTYTLVYSTTLESTNWIAAQPPIVANSSRAQFIDAGPQLTGDGDRFYTVIEHE
jgi:uncharacterized repeat protein (TIGR01451 family)